MKTDNHVENICKKYYMNYMNLSKRHILKKECLIPIELIFCYLDVSYPFNKLHERCLRVIYNGKKSSFEELLIKDNSLHTTKLFECLLWDVQTCEGDATKNNKWNLLIKRN